MPWPLLLLFLLSTGGLMYLLSAFSPSAHFMILSFPLSVLFVCFLLFFMSLYSISAFLTKRAVQGLIAGSVGVAFFLFRLFHLTNILFTILLLILLICVEGVVWKRK